MSDLKTPHLKQFIESGLIASEVRAFETASTVQLFMAGPFRFERADSFTSVLQHNMTAIC